MMWATIVGALAVLALGPVEYQDVMLAKRIFLLVRRGKRRSGVPLLAFRTDVQRENALRPEGILRNWPISASFGLEHARHVLRPHS